MKKINKYILFFCFYYIQVQSQTIRDTTQILDLVKTAYSVSENEPKRTILIGQQALKKSKKINFIKGEANANNVIGVGYDISSQYDSALYYYNKALFNCKKIKSPSLNASIYNNIGLTYWNLSDYKKALVNYHKALDIFKLINDVKGLAKTYNNLGLLNDDLFDEENAIVNYKDAILNYSILNDSNGLSVAYLNLGSTYYTQNNNKDAEFYYRESFKLKPANDYYGKSIVLLNWAQLKNSLNQLDSAIYLIEQSISLKEKLDDTNGLITSYNVLANTYASLKQYNNSVTSAKKALSLNQIMQSKRRLVKTYGLLKRAYLFMNQADSAMKYNDLEYQLKDSIFSENLSEAVANEKVKYKTLSVENENLALILKTEKQSFTIKTIWISLGFIFISLLLVYISYSRTKKNKLIILQQNQTNQINQVVFETEQLERERIARDLHDSVGQKLSVVKMQLSMKNADAQSSSKLLDEAIQDVRNVSHNLMPADLSKGLINALENMQAQINFSSSLLKVHLNIALSVQALIIDKQHSLLIYRMVQELVNNAIKYSQAQNIYIHMDCVKKHLKLNLTDDGIGFDIATLEQKEGIGIQNIKERVHQLIGNISLTSKIDEGTQYNISIPV
jgi:two-component system NarL family sensor kinase